MRFKEKAKGVKIGTKRVATLGVFFRERQYVCAGSSRPLHAGKRKTLKCDARGRHRTLRDSLRLKGGGRTLGGRADSLQKTEKFSGR